MQAETMQVGDLCSRPVIRISADADLTRCAALMRDEHVRSVVITRSTVAGEAALGIVTDRDLVVGALAQGLPARTALESLVTRPLACVGESDDLLAALAVMRDRGLRRLGVTDAAGDLVGIVALDDIMHAIAVQIDALMGVVDTGQVRERTGRPGASAIFVRKELPPDTLF